VAKGNYFNERFVAPGETKNYMKQTGVSGQIVIPIAIGGK